MSINKYYDANVNILNTKTPEGTCLYHPAEIDNYTFKEKNTVYYIVMMVLYFNKI